MKPRDDKHSEAVHVGSDGIEVDHHDRDDDDECE